MGAGQSGLINNKQRLFFVVFSGPNPILTLNPTDRDGMYSYS